MSTGTNTCDIVLPGYTLTGRIGSGGYAEVWRAEAPGGIEKAVKIVYGYYDDEFASQELKALERIKGVRHPFLLSLERFEILNGRLAILTELADMSLDQRRRQCCAEGMPGIPREELLRYMADAAEALDFLSQRHNLLHLDVKPENLLVSGDHLKVADFGLVKELATRTQNSLVSGMTPTYAAPEVFDDDPSAFSDQYSLAIVYQEMLVGTLPFPGRTAAQLAKQHTQAEPQLASVPAADRLILARALAKKPTDRFPSCQAFVDALLGQAQASLVATSPVPPRPPAPVPKPALPESGDTKPPSFCTTLRRAPEQSLPQLDVEVTQPVRRDKVAVALSVESPTPPEPVASEDIADIAVPAANEQLRREQPTLYLASGGVGIQVVSQLLRLITRSNKSDDYTLPIECLALDTNRDELREACSQQHNSALSPHDTLHLPLRLPKCYDQSREILGWVSRRWLYNIPRSLETRGYRALGRVALVDHSQRVVALINQKMQRLSVLANAPDDNGELRDSMIKVVLLAGTGGGTGGGMIIDLANAVRSIATKHDLKVEIHGFLISTCFADRNPSSPLSAANTYSLLTELNHAAVHGNESSGERTPKNEIFDSRQAPFDHVYWVPARGRRSAAPSVDPIVSVAKYLALDWTPESRATFRTCRSSQTPREVTQRNSFGLRQLGYASLIEQNRAFVYDIAESLATAVKHHWLTTDTSADWEGLVRDAQQAATVPRPSSENQGNPVTPATAVTSNDTSPLLLRGRFKEHKSLHFVTDLLEQIQRHLEFLDDRGRPRLIARDAKLIIDKAHSAVAPLITSAQHDSDRRLPLADTPSIKKLVVAASRRVFSRVVERFDPAQIERVLSEGAIDDMIRCECQTLLEESDSQPQIAAIIESLIQVEKSATAILESVSSNSSDCGFDRRTLIFVPHHKDPPAEVTELLNSRQFSLVVPAAVDDVLIVSEESGISPRSLALKLEHAFPGIGEAARRLLTRVDIDWAALN